MTPRADLDLGIVTGALSPAAGGLFESVRIPANRMAQSKMAVGVYGVRDAQFESVRSAWQVTDLQTFPHIGPLRLSFTPGMYRSVFAGDHQLLHQHGIFIYQSFIVDAWRRRTGRPTIVSPRGMLDPWALQNSRLRKSIFLALYEDRNLRNASVLHALNASEAEAFRAYGLTNPIAVIPNGIDLPDPARTNGRPDWMTGDDRKVLLFLGRLHPKKGLSELIAAWAQVRDISRPIWNAWRVVIAGWDDGGHRATWEGQIAQAGLVGHVTFVGPLQGQAKADALHAASAFVLPSHSEGMPMSILEAWAYRLPVFMTAACNLPHGFTHGAAIEIAAEPVCMAKTLASGLGDSRRHEDLGRAGHALVEQSYTWDRIIADMQLLYAWVLGAAGPPPFVQVHR